MLGSIKLTKRPFCTKISRYFELQGPVAQRLEQLAHNQLVAGSIPAGPTKMRLESFDGSFFITLCL